MSTCATARGVRCSNIAANASVESTTVSIIETASTMHVGDLDGSTHVKGKSGKWEAFVTVSIHDEECSILAEATVSGTWSGDTGGSVSGVTGSDGTVTFSTGEMTAGSTVTFTVDEVTHSSLAYNGEDNHDSDGDSDGTTIEIAKP